MISTSARRDSSVPVMAYFLGSIKFLLFLILMALFLVHHYVIQLLVVREGLRVKYYVFSLALTSKLALILLNVKVESNLEGVIEKKLIVSNHLSYIDVLIYASLCPSLFITSREIQETFILGKLAELSGAFFIERRKEKRTPATTVQELDLIKQKISQGFNVFLFPEGTSSDGRGVLPFKSTFFELAVDANIAVVPMTLKYFGRSREVVPWYGAMTFPDHLFRVCLQKEISAKVFQSEASYEGSRFDLARSTHEKILSTYERN